ncbi:MAG: DUF2169 domain-containing protein [Polyangiaceae bacterium]|nr:DUF2169 domain-containing protein [Polyangiaceae bacterium]
MFPLSAAPTLSVAPGGTGSVVLWRHRNRNHLTVVVKATFALVPNGRMAWVDPRPFHPSDVHAGNRPTRGIVYASDRVPVLMRREISFVGQAWSFDPFLPETTSRLLVFRHGKPIVNKSLRVFFPRGTRSVPLDHEHAVGGPGVSANPLGTEAPSVLHAQNPDLPGSFAPVGRVWPSRRGLLGETPRKALSADVISLPDQFNFDYFHAVPPDQQISRFRVDDVVVLEALLPNFPRLTTQLPYLEAWVDPLPEMTPFRVGMPSMSIDSVAIQGESATCDIVYRGIFDVPSFESVAGGVIQCGLRPISAQDTQFPANVPLSVSWVDPADIEPEPATQRWDGAVPLPSQIADPPTTPLFLYTPPTELPPPLPLDRTTAPGMDDYRPSVLPFDPGGVPRLSVPDLTQTPTGPTRDSLGETRFLADTDNERLAAESILPFVTQAPPRDPTIPKFEGQTRFVRKSALIPLFGEDVWTGCSIPTKLPGVGLARAFVVKASFQLSPGERALFRSEPNALTGDLPSGLEGDVYTPSDFAVHKPNADITLTGAARPTSPVEAMVVSFVFGRDKKVGFERQIRVVGDRIYKNGSPTPPASFSMMPLLWSRTLGAESCAEKSARPTHSLRGRSTQS